MTNSEGVATVGEWRLGPLPVENRLRAQTIDHPYQVTIEATAGVGAPSSLQIVTGGANLAAVVGQEVPLVVWGAVTGAAEETLLAVAERAETAHVVAAWPNGQDGV